jgi:hypothetical protein
VIASMQEQPMFPRTIHGMRTWRIVRQNHTERYWLQSLAQAVLWTPGRRMTAECEARWWGCQTRHDPPDPDCACGIYAHHPLVSDHLFPRRRPRRLGRRLGGGVLVTGLIEAWGRIELHGDGFRAQYARPFVLFEDVSAEYGETEAIGGAARTYGVPMEQTFGPLGIREYCVANGLGLDSATVRALLDADSTP